MSKHYFLCGKFDKNIIILAIKSDDSEWKYFEEVDSFIDHHASIRINIETQMKGFAPNELTAIGISLSPAQLITYFDDEKFIFHGKALKTFIQLTRVTEKSGRRTNSDELEFTWGKSNPLVFLKEFENCDDAKTDNDKLFKLRRFVPLPDRPQFSELYFKSDWGTARQKFLRKYSIAFTENKKKELDFRFEEEETLRLFVKRKFDALSTYTTLPLCNQMEMIMLDLPNSVANLFIVNDKVNRTEKEILEFCYVIQEFVDEMDNETAQTVTPTPTSPTPSNVVQNVYEFEVESETSDSDCSTKKKRPRGRPRKQLQSVFEESETCESDYSNRSTTTSCSTIEN